MKKFVALILALVLCLSLCACGEEKKSGSSDIYIGSWVNLKNENYVLSLYEGGSAKKATVGSGNWEVVDGVLNVTIHAANGTTNVAGYKLSHSVEGYDIALVPVEPGAAIYVPKEAYDAKNN